ncbi:MAG: hypothetical protein C3F06_08735 [Candidatus Methanoperedenaceae archaeon]|nr:MAG: hypothetical protein C3F06_08735 [Candidatus Methanoperedenaceae archaeon]
MIEKSIETTLEISFSINKRLDELSYKDYPSNTSIDLIKLFKPKSRFILRPDWEFNYSFFELTDAIRETFMNVVPNIENTLNDFKDGLAILSFPSTEKNNIFFHCALSHEIGHFFL